jgi:hypothetical protein
MPPPSLNRRIILHAGFHKTGTTTLQACLRSNAARLLPLWRVETRPDNGALRAVVEAARDYSASGDPSDLAMVSAQTVVWLASLDLAPGAGLLVSSEDLAGHMPGRFGVAHYGAAAKILHAVIDIAGQLYERQVHIDVLLTTRDRHAWLRSLYYQQAKHPDLTADFDSFCASIPKAADHEAVAAKLRRKIGEDRVHMVRLEQLSQRRLGPAEAMFDLAGLPDTLRSQLEPAAARNTMPAPDLAEAFVAANRLGLPLPELKRMKDDLQKAAVSKSGNLG